MTIHVSEDDCKTWAYSKILYEGPSAYSDMAISVNGDLCCLYECGNIEYYEKITFTKIAFENLLK